LALFLDDADGTVSLKNRVLDIKNGLDAFSTAGGHDILGIKAHSAHGRELPLAVPDQNKRGSIDNLSDTRRDRLKPGK
jgi:hypothetical protein